MPNMRLPLIAAGLVLAVILLLVSGLSAPEFGMVMMGGAVIVAIIMYLISRRRSRKIVERDRANRIPPKF